MLTQSMRPKWRTDTYTIPMADGVYLRGNRSRLFLKGKSLYALLTHLIPNLDGEATLAEISGGLEADRKRMLANLIGKLFAHGFLSDCSQDQQQTLNPLEQEVYAPELALIESWQPEAVTRFEHFRRQRLLLIGSGPGLAALVQASLQSGLHQIEVLATPEEVSEQAGQWEKLTHETAGQQIRLRDAPNWDDEDEVRRVLQAHDAVLHLAGGPLLTRAQMLNRLCLEEQKVLMQAVLVGERAWLGPLVCSESANCWECAWRRLRTNLTALSPQSALWEFRDEPLFADSLTGTQATLLANRLVFALFRYFTQVGWPETVSGLEVFDLVTCQSESHTFLPHPHCLACQHPVAPTGQHFLEQLQQVQRRNALDPATFLAEMAGCVDEQSGLFATFENSDFVQVPLAVYQVTLPDPLLERSQALSVSGVGSKSGEARLRAALRACACYAVRLMERRLLSSEAVQEQRDVFPVVTNEQLIEMPGRSQENELWTWAQDLQTHQAVLVPGARVFSTPDRQERGVAAGLSWEEALCQALLDWCNYLTVAEVGDARQAFLRVDLARAPLTPVGRHLCSLLDAAGESVAVYDLTGSLEVPTFATFADEKVVAYSSHCDVAQALSLGLEQAVLRCQAEQFRQPAYAPASVPDFPALLRSEQLTVPRSTAPQTWPVRRAWLLERLRENGLRALVVPLDHDPALSRLSPFIVCVLVGRREL